jgi:hypothetical protein
MGELLTIVPIGPEVVAMVIMNSSTIWDVTPC